MELELLPMLRASLIRKEPSRSKKRSYETRKNSDAHFSILHLQRASGSFVLENWKHTGSFC